MVAKEGRKDYCGMVERSWILEGCRTSDTRGGQVLLCNFYFLRLEECLCFLSKLMKIFGFFNRILLFP